MGGEINLMELSDLQNTYLTQLSYLDINVFGKRKSEITGVPIYNLKSFLLNPRLPFCGIAMTNKETFEKVAAQLLGEYKLPTDEELLQYIIDIGLGDLKIIGVEADSKSGFQAMAFKDDLGNIGISFRGSDLDISNGAIKDWIEADLLEYFTNDSMQRHRALALFDSHKCNDGNNYLYGHSLGGNLSSHVFAEHYNEIAKVFTVNGYPINQALLNSQEKIDVFNSDKYICCSICGDVVSHLKSCELYKNNIRMIKNNGEIKPSLLSAHLAQSASFDDGGNFNEASREEMVESLGRLGVECAAFAQKVRESLNDIDANIGYAKIHGVEIANKYKDELLSKIDKGWKNQKDGIKSIIDESKTKIKSLTSKEIPQASDDPEMEESFELER